MGLRDFLPLPKSHRRTRSEARSEIGSVENPGEVDLVVPRPTESTPDLGIGASSTPPTYSPTTPRNQEPNGTQTASPEAIDSI